MVDIPLSRTHMASYGKAPNLILLEIPQLTCDSSLIDHVLCTQSHIKPPHIYFIESEGKQAKRKNDA